MRMFYLVLVAVLTLGCLTVSLPADDREHDDNLTIYSLAAIEWKPGPPSLPAGAQIAVLEGDPNKEGAFVFRVKVPDGYPVGGSEANARKPHTLITGACNKYFCLLCPDD